MAAEEKSSTYLSFCFRLIAAVAFAAALKITSSIFIPIVLALFFFVLLLPLSSFFERKKVPGFLNIMLCLLLFVLVFLGLCLFLVMTVRKVIIILPGYEKRFIQISQAMGEKLAPLAGRFGSGLVNSLVNYPWFSIISGWITAVSSTFVSIGKTFVVILLYLAFLLVEKKSIVSKIDIAFSHEDEGGGLVKNFMSKMNYQLSVFMLKKLFLCLFAGMAYYALAMIVGLDFPFTCAIIAIILNFIPTIGPFLAVALASFIALVQFFPVWSHVIAFVIPCVALQLTAIWFANSQTKGVYLNLSPFVILLSLVLWYYVWGIAGLFLGVPIMSMLQMVFSNIPGTRGIAELMSNIKSAQEQKKRDEELYEYRDPDTAASASEEG